ncbi:MAG TPA: hydantoinase/oxoprolinase family protein [Candidatus Bathyarchaeia archaeon]|nr:hydantoinase/oxoprolinase family protein [Candidatus Bathyarchaeia archaeon]
MSRTAQLCIGIDVGGTFTDAVVTDGTSTWRAKAPTTPADLGEGVLAACRLAARRAGADLTELLPRVRRFGLGTTAVTNRLASWNGLKVGLVTTRGFESMVPLARGHRESRAGLRTLPRELVNERAIVGVDERIDSNGRVIRPLDPAEVVAGVRRLVESEGVQAIAISFLWAFRNPVHEEAAVAAVKQALPQLPVMSGAALHPVIREYERTTFALLNAFVSGAFQGIDRLGRELERLGLRVPLLLVHSAGGSITPAEARRCPIGLAQSGPAAGVAASLAVASASGIADLLTCDMGGTSFDVSVIASGVPARRTRGRLFGVWTGLSLIDVESIGAGGGSIGWVDSRGMLRVGPRSAGSVPGPACYGRGGADPTVTDALLVLGYLDPERFLGGDMRLDGAAARSACARLGERLGLDAEDAAWGIRRLALEGMVKAVRSRVAARGLDPRTNALLSYGGCGALFTAEIALAIGVPRVLIPELASVLSAFGAATADVRRERVKSLMVPMPIEPALLARTAAALAAEVEGDLAADGIAPGDRRVGLEADLRFKRQTWELAIPLSAAAIDAAAIDRLLEDFRAEYGRRYGRGSIVLGAPIELVSLRAVGIGRTIQASLAVRSDAGKTVASAPVPAARRAIRVERGPGGAREVEVYSADALGPGHRLTGPAVIDGMDTTVWVPERACVEVDVRGSLVVQLGGAAALQANAGLEPGQAQEN